MNIINIKDWKLGIQLSKEKPFLISGPCSAETETQVLQTCTQIANLGVDVLRAGIWKPRTRPGSFEGIGKKALPWLVEAGKQTNLPVCCEVANANHVEEALKHGIDILWLGARTTVNPFAVQAIADALQGVDIPIMIKNPVNPDLELWIGAIERIAQAGIQKIAAIHRGFSVYNAPKYRNQPQWEIPIELRRRIANLEIICDPSHIAGKRDLLFEIAQHALDLNFDGLMLESHITPDTAWSDAQQQVTPEGLQTLMKQLITRQLDTDNLDYLNKINHFRTLIDNLDTQTLHLLSQRMEIVRQIGLHKKESNIAILQIERWLNVRNSALEKAASSSLSESFVEDIINTIHKESIRQQTTIMRKD
ncbi:bifunctional 3-deoxy-7-phosphoheptulonate synthase/chorismate mutase type II [Aureispira sp. CCB-E]|uniref:bifunctional 3-deoxy-7-phosphoheptulonate synthase/chorismate mutase type II n=1 Tax=Aureispira sp. CCB-E TaxID=3051121 RepID=UPI0028689459|nr:bifunctional 3-deoxy-7-phosphoheptulonate synthase/chorismate mutase type II [Aureispira sp. CCB-E]WMX12097.1 bifunctional 3-deoxy-7-phosphoheptulonate synthase/chorismate mutase type II [Aureispira sp. CCB-E]